MKTNNQILTELNSTSKGLELLIKAFDLSVEKCGTYKTNRHKDYKIIKSFCVK